MFYYLKKGKQYNIFKLRITKNLNILGWQGFLDRTMGVINTYSY